MFSKGFTISGASLELLKAGETGIITLFKNPDATPIKKLYSMGITPGTSITLEQCSPTFVVKAGENRMTLDKATIRSIYVRIQ